MKKNYLITIFTSIFLIIIISSIQMLFFRDDTSKLLKVGFLYVGDSSTSYTGNFIKTEKSLTNKYGTNIQIISKKNVPESNCEPVLMELISENCDIIFSTSYGFGESVKKAAEKNPHIQFCQATCSNANEEPILKNYHTFMGKIFEGRYVSGVIAGLKLQELINQKKITKEQAKIGYVGAFPLPEVISGYTAFILGIKSIVPEATMIVKYTNSWTDYNTEKKITEELIQEDCVIISQHSDTVGPAIACEEANKSKIVYLVSYNQSMATFAPTTYLCGSKINWEPYILNAVDAVYNNKEFSKTIDATFFGNDATAGFDKNWVQMLEMNEISIAPGTKEKVEKTIELLNKNKIDVFYGNYIGVNPENPNDIIDLNTPYIENSFSSAQTFNYILKDVVFIE
jgi:basic membrane protein A